MQIDKAHFLVLQHATEVSEYIDEHKRILLEQNPERDASWLANEHVRKFNNWFRDRISGSSTLVSNHLAALAMRPNLTVSTYQGYDINGYTFYTRHQNEKSSYQNSGVRVENYDGDSMTPYYGQIEEIWELEYGAFQIAFFRCSWVNLKKGVVKDKYGFTSVDLKSLGYRADPFVLTKHVAQVFYVPDTTNKRLKVVIPGNSVIFMDGYICC